MKMPPKEKIYEAFSTIADNRIELNKTNAIVKSSDNKKEYKINWNDSQISSSDNATFWQKYPGYPIIAVWLKNKIIKYDETIVTPFKDINWHELNKKNRNNYQKSVDAVLNKLVEKNIDTEYIETEVDAIYEQINSISYEIVRKIK